MSEEAFQQVILDDNLSRPIDPLKAKKELDGPQTFYGVMRFKNGRYATVRAKIDPSKAEALTQFGHFELEREFAEEQMLRTLTQVERFRRF
jgi:hypothetical protein